MIGSLRRPRSRDPKRPSPMKRSRLCACAGSRSRYGDVEVLRDVDLDAERGEFLALLGPSGCGKTTTLRVIAGFERPHAGSIEIGGDRVYDAPPPAAGGFLPKAAGSAWSSRITPSSPISAWLAT